MIWVPVEQPIRAAPASIIAFAAASGYIPFGWRLGGGGPVMPGDEILQRALNLLFEAVPAGSQVILFGSRASGKARPDSDYDFLVVEPQVDDRFAEMVRLSALLGSALIPADVVVVSRDAFERWRDEPNSLAGRASVEGTVYESAA